MTATGRQLVMQDLLEACKYSKVADIQRAVMFLQRAQEVRGGNRSNRTASRKAQATASKRKAGQQDSPLSW